MEDREMPANIAYRNGRAMAMVAGQNAWWDTLGKSTVQGLQTWQDTVKAADLDWDVVKKQFYARNPLGNVVDVPLFGTFRTDDGAYLGGAVGDGYEILQNRDAFNTVDSLIQSSDGAHYETAGALGAGERIWCLARIPEADFVIDGGDKHETFVMVATSHDGSLAFTVKLVDTRVVCANTLAIALNEAGRALKIRHTASAKARLDAAQVALRDAKNAAVGIRRKMELLAESPIKREQASKIFDRLFPKSKDEDASQTRRDNTIADVLRLFERNDNNAFPSVKGTAYNLLNAITEYTDHERTARGNGSKLEQVKIARAESAVFGSGDRLKTHALQVILEETCPAPLLDRIIAESHAAS